MKKIVVIGPESTGKSTLCEKLAAHYHTSWCPEYAREFLMTHGMNYTYDDLLTIAQGQLELEDRYISLLKSTSQTPNSNAARLAQKLSGLLPSFSLTPCFSWVENRPRHVTTVSTVLTECGKPLKRLFRWWRLHTQLKQGVNKRRLGRTAHG